MVGERHLLDTESDNAHVLRLKSMGDVERSHRSAIQLVRGHDTTLETCLTRIFENLTLRNSRRNGSRTGPLASFLLVGSEGIGKQYSCRVLSKLLYDCKPLIFECEKLTPEAVVGQKTQSSALMDAVRKQPHALLLFRKLELASNEVQALFAELLTTGSLTQPGSHSGVLFHDTIIVFTSTCVTASTSKQTLNARKSVPEAEIPAESLVDEPSVNQSLLHALTSICHCQQPNEHVKAEVVALLMKKECADHKLTLSSVAPEILALQVSQIEEADGFEHTPSRIKRLLRKALVAAVASQSPSISLHVSSR